MVSKIRSAERVNVLIVGAGPVGLVSALLLLRDGLSVRVIAKETKPRTGCRGPGIQPRTLELYKFLGVLDDILAGSGPHQSIHQYTSPDNGEPPVILWDQSKEKVEEKVDKPYLSPRIIAQVDHEAILRACLLRDYGCQVEFGTELISYEQGSDTVEATLLKISTHKTETETTQFDWLIGADGAHSVVRKHLGCSFLGESIKKAGGMLLADIHLLNGWGDDHIKSWGALIEKSLMIRPYRSASSAQPKSDTRVQVMITDKDLDDTIGKLKLNGVVGDGNTVDRRDMLVDMIYELSGRRDLVFGDLIGIGVWRPNVRMVDNFGKGKVWIAGDASHVHSPTGGQGLNSGVQDAFNLCWKLSLVHKGLNKSTSNELMTSYTEERMRVVKAMLNVTTRLLRQTFGVNEEKSVKIEVGVAQTIGTTTISADSPDKKQPSGINVIRGFELRMFGINYRGSSIVLDEVAPPAEVLDPYKMSPEEPVRGGDRAPEAPDLKILHRNSSGGTTSLFEIFDTTKHTALVFFQSPLAIQEFSRALDNYPNGTMRIVVIHPQGSTERVLIDGKQEGDVVEVLDTKGHAYGSYLRGVDFHAVVASEGAVSQETRGVVIVVRPDGHVGAIVKDVAGVDRYRRKVFT
ncbi:MAG: FAD binding domain-containing protein [Lentinula lateritia]|uniref:FAD binding domain-containing protein n=1 Tax=Lentinula lateritia TaxID=40482 RepID=A0ABQ8VI06_9AGAR|nr:MAG: FAD binding domain-containing protein [Lentinula lateritia]KAJ4488629.1 FAD binding domain-containing protein [Lentinula lateritia]